MARTPLIASGLVIVLVGGAGLSPVAGQDRCPSGVITEVVYDVGKPFRPKEASEDASLGWFLRTMNYVHIRTRVRTVGWELHFEEGDCFDPQLLAESERSLRSLRYIAEADITSERVGSGGHRVTVQVRDSWALSGGLSLSFDGGAQITGASVSARNVLGTGTRLGFFRAGYRDRQRVGLISRQPNLFGTRVDGTLHGGDTRSGAYYSQSLFRPYTGELGAGAFRQVARSRDDYFSYSVDPATGYSQALLRFEEERFGLTVQRRFGDAAGPRLVTGVGVSREEIRFPFGAAGFALVVDDQFDQPLEAADPFRSEISSQMRAHAANRFSVTLGIRDLTFGSVLGLDALQAPQDIVTGSSLLVSVAPAVTKSRGSPSDVFIRAQGLWGYQTAHSYVRLSGDVQTRRIGTSKTGSDQVSAGWRDLIYDLGGSAYWLPSVGTRLFARITYTAGHGLDRPFQLTLGGREGIRGYNDDAYPGARRLLATIEQRFSIPQLSTSWADVGLAFFTDVGRGWAGAVPFGEDSDWRAGAGAGFRFGLPAGASNTVRIDVGLPITGERGTRGVMFRIYTELFGLLDRRSWPTQVERSRWYGSALDLTTRPYNPLAGN